MKTDQQRPRSSRPVQGCGRCKGGGAIDVLLRRLGGPVQSYALRCACDAGRNFQGLTHIDRFTSGWADLGATVVEWPTIAERRAS